MPRAAGDSHVYTFKVKQNDGPKLPSVTHIIKFMKDELGFGGMAWWGYKIGIAASDILGGATYEDLQDPGLDAPYEAAKQTGWNPNTIRDEAGESGTGAHELLEHAAIGDIEIVVRDDGIWVKGEPETLAPIRYPAKQDSAKRSAWIREKKTAMKCRGKGHAAALWWLDNEDKHGLIYPELTVWSMKHGYAGTMDFARQVMEPVGADDQEPGGFEIIDYKSHKPAQGMHKDGGYAEGKGPAYLDDLMQTQAYGRAFYEMGLGVPVSYRVVLLQPKPDERGMWYYEDTRTVDFELFLDFKTIHDKRCPKPECRLLARAYS